MVNNLCNENNLSKTNNLLFFYHPEMMNIRMVLIPTPIPCHIYYLNLCLEVETSLARDQMQAYQLRHFSFPVSLMYFKGRTTQNLRLGRGQEWKGSSCFRRSDPGLVLLLYFILNLPAAILTANETKKSTFSMAIYTRDRI